MGLKVYGHRMSQPARAVYIFCKMNGIEFEEISVNFFTRETASPEFQEINPMKKVPAIVDGSFKLFESHAILRYLACAFPGVPDHWYPTDLQKRAKIDSVLDWHHLNLRHFSMCFLKSLRLPQVVALAPAHGRQPNPQEAIEAEKHLSESLEKIETFWLQGSGPFLLGNSEPSIADLSLVCEIMQLEVLDENDINRILGPHEKVQQWMEDTKTATKPHFEEIHGVIFETKARLQKQRLLGANNA